MIKRVSEAFAQGEINEPKLRETRTEEAKLELLKLYRIGRASVQIIVTAYFRRCDTFDLKGRP